MTQLSDHFTLEEMTRTSTGLPNVPDLAALAHLRRSAAGMEKVRALLGQPIQVNSAFRSLAVNRAVGSADTSAHVKGYAVDFICPLFGTPQQIAVAIIASGLEFDQIIFEGTWVHISFDPQMRGQALTAHFERTAKTTYSLGIVA